MHAKQELKKGRNPMNRRVNSARTDAASSLNQDMVRSLLDATSDYAFLVDRKGMVLAANTAMAARFNLQVEELVGECVYDFFNYENALRRKAVVVEVLETGQPRHFEDQTSQGQIFECRAQPVPDESGEVTRVAIFASEVTSRQAVEKERLRLISAIEQAVEGVLILDADFVIQYANQGFEAMTGYSQGEIKGHNVQILYLEEKQKQVFQQIIETLNTDGAWTGRSLAWRKDGTTFQCEKTVSPIQGKHGVVHGYVSVWRDVTQLTILERELRHAQKMEAIATLAGGIAHDFNNILGPIILHAEMGLDMLPASHPAKGSFIQILDASNRAKALADQILNLGHRRESDAPVPFSLRSLVKECLKLLRPSLPATISIVEKYCTKKDVILADPTLVHQVIMNLCTNAAHSMQPSGGMLTLEIRNVRVKDDVTGTFFSQSKGNYVRLTVGDTGTGIQAEHLEKIFDPFFTTKPTGMGTGLGLSVVRNIVLGLQGSVQVESQLGQGATFHVFIPVTSVPIQPKSKIDHRVVGSRGGESILVVDDDDQLLHSCAAALERLDYKVTACSSPGKALALIRQNPSAFCAVFSDVTMPGMTGVDLAREIHTILPEMPIVLATGYSKLLTPATSRALCIDALIKKPYRMETLAKVLRQVIDGDVS